MEIPELFLYLVLKLRSCCSIAACAIATSLFWVQSAIFKNSLQSLWSPFVSSTSSYIWNEKWEN